MVEHRNIARGVDLHSKLQDTNLPLLGESRAWTQPVTLGLRMSCVVAVVLAAVVATQETPARAESPKKVFGLDRVIAFNYLGGKYDPKQLRSVTFIEPTAPKDWRYWTPRGVATAVGHTWFDLLRNPVDKAVDILANGDYGGNPKPVVSIDEFGFDYGGETDQKAARILRETKRKRPELGLAVWEMRGPIPKVLGDAYRDVADLVMLESYLKDKDDYWFVAAQVQSARIHGVLPKTIVALGIGKGGNPGEEWARTKEELEQQVRFVRMLAPEAPGIGFYSGGDWPELVAKADELCSHYADLPTDGSKLPADVAALGRFFSERHEKPVLVCSPMLVEPNRSAADPGKLVDPKTMRACLLNLGDRDATDVRIRLRNPKDKGGNVFAEAVVPLVPKRGEATAVLPVTAEWKVWKTWEMEVQGTGCEVRICQWKH